MPSLAYRNVELQKSRSFAGELSKHQREIINTQMKLVEPIASKHCKYDSPKTTTFNTMDFADEVKQECPLLYQILHTMVIRQNTHKSTLETPEKRIRLACLLLNFINYVRSRTNNTIPLFISLALASRGISSYQHDLLHSLRIVVDSATVRRYLQQNSDKRTPHTEVEPSDNLGCIHDNFNHRYNIKTQRIKHEKSLYTTHLISRLAVKFTNPKCSGNLSKEHGLYTPKQVTAKLLVDQHPDCKFRASYAWRMSSFIASK